VYKLLRVDFWHLKNGKARLESGIRDFGSRRCDIQHLAEVSFICCSIHVVHN